MSSALVQPLMAVMKASTIVFGSLHLLACNYAFPTVPERWLWRAAALVGAYLPLLPLAINDVTAMLDHLEQMDARRSPSTLHSTFKEFVVSPPHSSSPNSRAL